MWLAIAVALVAANLRPAVASIGPVIDDVRDGLHLSSLSVSILTSLPVVCFGALAPLGPWLTRRIGMARAVGVFCVLIAVGLVVRIGPDAATMYGGTLIVAAGIAALNVLIPVLIKQDFPHRTGSMMGVYTLSLTGAAAVAAGLTVPVGDAIGHGWRGGLGVWAVLALVAILFWVPQIRAAGEARVVTAAASGLFRDRIAWLMTIYFGFQSLSFYAMLTWLPSVFEAHGVDASHAGALLSVSTAVQAPVALATPALAMRLHRQTSLVIGTVVFTGLGLLAVLLFPMGAPYVWVIVLGIGQGASFPLVLTLMVLRTRTSDVTQQLSSMAQGVGYLIAAAGPLLAGILHSVSGHWTLPLAVLIALLVPQGLAGYAVARPGFAGEPTRSR